MKSQAVRLDEAESEAWGILDVDDSDLSSLIRPCKRKSPPPPTTKNPKKPVGIKPNDLSILQPCSSLRSSQTLTPHREASSSSRAIPGPAGAVQAAMLRKVHKDPSSFGVEGEPIPTQEYIRRAMEEPGGDDDDFSRDPWLSAVDFVRAEGLVGDDGVSIGTPLSVIKSKLGFAAKVNQVVAIVKTCCPNGLGDLLVSLKDLTGSLDASIHRKVVAESKFGKDIHVGAVLILQKVSTFAASRSSCCINITLNNLLKVITKETLLSLEPLTSATTVKDAASVFGENKGMWTQPRGLTVEGRTEGIMNNLRQKPDIIVCPDYDTEMEEGNTSSRSKQFYEILENQRDVGSKQSVSKKQDSNEGTERTYTDDQNNKHPVYQEDKDTAVGLSTNDEEEVLRKEHANPSTQPDQSNLSDGFQRVINSATTEVSQKQAPTVSTGSLPQWTDEQLDELFDFD